MRSVISLACGVLLLAEIVVAQPGLDLVPSATSSGMGQLSIIVPADGNFFYNPALLPFSLDRTVVCGAYPGRSHLLGNPFMQLWNGFLAARLPLATDSNTGLPSWEIAAGYQRVWADYGGGMPATVIDETESDDVITAAVAWHGYADVGFGVSTRLVTRRVFFWNSAFPPDAGQGTAFDVGTYGRVAIWGNNAGDPQGLERRLRLIGGVAMTDIGRPYWIDNWGRYNHPHAWRVGLGIEGEDSDFRLLVGWQFRKWLDGGVVSHMFGAELEWQGAITVRSGYGIMQDDHFRTSSCGVSVSTSGLVAEVTAGRLKLPFDVRMNYSRTNTWPWKEFDSMNRWSLQLEI